MKTRQRKKKQSEETVTQAGDIIRENLISDENDTAQEVNTIEEFIEIKKLQNRLLEKMINKIKESDKQDNL